MAVCDGTYKLAEFSTKEGTNKKLIECGNGFFVRNATVTVSGNDVTAASVFCCHLKVDYIAQSVDGGEQDVNCGDGKVIQRIEIQYDKDLEYFLTDVICSKLRGA